MLVYQISFSNVPITCFQILGGVITVVDPDHSGHGLSQWVMTLQCNVITHWLSPYPEWFICIILGMGSPNERWRYNVTSSLIGWAHIHSDPCGRPYFILDGEIVASPNIYGLSLSGILSNIQWAQTGKASLTHSPTSHIQPYTCDITDLAYQRGFSGCRPV